MNSKRNAIKIIGGSTTLCLAATGNWSKPIINTIVLPAHAQTSEGEEDPVFLPSNADICEPDGNGGSRFKELVPDFSVDGYEVRKDTLLRNGILGITDPNGADLGYFNFNPGVCGLSVDSVQVFELPNGPIFITVGEGPYGPIVRITQDPNF